MSSSLGVKGDLTGKGGLGSAGSDRVYQAKEHKILNVIPEHWGAMEGFKQGCESSDGLLCSDYWGMWERAETVRTRRAAVERLAQSRRSARG